MELNKEINHGHYLLALHTTSETLGIAVLDLRDLSETIRSSTIKIERNLSNYLFFYIKELLPSKEWKEISRISVATGPGGFTGTRISIAMARTIAQQTGCQIDGVSNFTLIASRIYEENYKQILKEPFWISSLLKRRGLIVGKYKINTDNNTSYYNKVIELESPHFLNKKIKLSPIFDAVNNIDKDTKELLKISLSAHKNGKKSTWQDVLPIYSTSPVDNM